MPGLSDVFGSDDNDSNQSSQTTSDQTADGSADASNDGISIQNESASRDEDGNESYESTGIDTGGTDLGLDGDLGSMIENISDSASSSGNTELLDN